MAPGLGARARAYMGLNKLPFLAVKLQRLQKPEMFIASPSSGFRVLALIRLYIRLRQLRAVGFDKLRSAVSESRGCGPSGLRVGDSVGATHLQVFLKVRIFTVLPMRHGGLLLF